MSKYKNCCEFLSPLFTIISIMSTIDEFKTTNTLVFQCKEKQHENKLSSEAFSNKKSKSSLESFCTTCYKEKELEKKTHEFISTIKEKTGHTIVKVDFISRVVEYQCGNCNKISNSYTNNLLANTGVCGFCQNKK